MTPKALAGRVALVTGASRGIGRAIAESLAGAGARVILVARGESALRDVAAAIAPLGVVEVCDITDPEAVTRLAERVHAPPTAQTHTPPQVNTAAHEPALDIIVNNAGLFPLASLDIMEPALFEESIRANLIAPFYVLRALLPQMKARGSGHVVTIGSVADRMVFAGNGAYSAGKFGQRAMHEVLRQELQSTGVRNTLVSPAATDTNIWDAIDPDNTPGFPKRASMLQPADVADAVLWAVTRPAHINVDEVRLSRS